MTYSLKVTDRYEMILSDFSFKWCRKKPTISVYDQEENTEIKVVSFNNKETFEWFVSLFKKIGEANRI